MLLRSIGALLLTAGATHGFKNSSPFFMLSTEPSNGGFENQVVNTADKVTRGVLEAVDDCAQSKYFIVSQPGLTIADLQTSEGFNELAKNEEYKQQVNVQSVLSNVDAGYLVGKIASKCGFVEEEAHRIDEHASREAFTGAGKEVVAMKFDPLPEKNDPQRTVRLQAFQDHFKAYSPKPTENHMIIVLSSPIDTFQHPEHLYEMDEPYPTAMHQDLKRDIKYSPLKSSNGTMQDGLPLFEKYQFLSPGIFMGLTVSLLLVVMLWIGVSAIAGLEVSYMAFSKEMGPAAQNKGKQQ